jgi:hypothetical protein
MGESAGACDETLTVKGVVENMKHIRIIGLALVAAFAMSAVAATSALALSHTYTVETKKLEANETKEIRSSAATEFTLKGEDLGVKSETKCSKIKLDAALHPVIVGGTTGTSKNELIEFEGCKAKLGSAECKEVAVESASTNNELVTILAPAALSGKLGTLFTPSSGTTFSKVKFTKCGILSITATVEGSTVALVPSELESKLGMLSWSESSEITEVEKQNGEKVKTGLKANGNKATLNGEATVELLSGQSWSAL